MLNGKENGLDEEYIKRREASKLIDPKLVSFLNRATSRILSNQSLDGISGIVKYENAADFSDYDFSSVEQLPKRIIDSKMKYSKNTGYKLLDNCLEKFISCIEEEQQTHNLSELYCKSLEQMFYKTLEKIKFATFTYAIDFDYDNAVNKCKEFITKHLEVDEIDSDETFRILDKDSRLKLMYDDEFLIDIFNNSKINEAKKGAIVGKLLSSYNRKLLKDEKILASIFKYAENISIEELDNINSAIIAISKDENLRMGEDTIKELENNSKIGIFSKKKIVDTIFENISHSLLYGDESYIESFRNKLEKEIQKELSTKSISEIFDNEENYIKIDEFLKTQKERFSGINYKELISRIIDNKKLNIDEKINNIGICLNDGKDKLTSSNYNDIIKKILKYKEFENYRKIELIQQCVLNGLEKPDEKKKLLKLLVKQIIKEEQQKDEKESSKTLDMLLMNPNENLYVSSLFVAAGVDLNNAKKLNLPKIINCIFDNDDIESMGKYEFLKKISQYQIGTKQDVDYNKIIDGICNLQKIDGDKKLEIIENIISNNQLYEETLKRTINQISEFEDIDFSKKCDFIDELDPRKAHFEESDYFQLLSNGLKSVKTEEERQKIYDEWLNTFKRKMEKKEYPSEKYRCNSIMFSIYCSKILEDNQKVELYQKVIEDAKKDELYIKFENVGHYICEVKNVDEDKKFDILKIGLEEYKKSPIGSDCVPILKVILDFEDIDESKKLQALEDCMIIGDAQLDSNDYNYNIKKGRAIYETILNNLFDLDNLPEEKKIEILKKCLDVADQNISGYTCKETITGILELEETDSSTKTELISSCLQLENKKFNKDEYMAVISKILESDQLENKNLEMFEQLLENGRRVFDSASYTGIISELLYCDAIDKDDKAIQVKKCLDYGQDRFEAEDYPIITNIILNSKQQLDDDKKIDLIQKLAINGYNQYLKKQALLNNRVLHSRPSMNLFKGVEDVLRTVNEKSNLDDQLKENIFDGLIQGLLKGEKEIKIKRGFGEVKCAGLFLNHLLDNPEENKDIIQRFIKAGSCLNYIDYINEYNTPTYIPTLYKAMIIENDELRNSIVTSMLDAGVNTNSEYISIDYNEKRSSKKKIRVINMRNGELKKIMSDRKLGEDKTNVPKSHTNTSNASVEDYLESEVKLSKDEILELAKLYEKFGRSLSQEVVEGLKTKKLILDVCNASHEGFTKFGNILFNPVNVLYARLMFFEENGIKIEPKKLDETMGATKKTFAKKYGRKLGLATLNDPSYFEDVKMELIKRYPLPHNRDKMLENIRKVAQKDDACL